MSRLLLVLVLHAPAPEAEAPDAATPDSPAIADRLERQALDAYRDGDLETASRLLASAWLLVPLPRYLYMQAVIEADRSRCDAVRELVERYLATGPTPQEEQDAQRQIDRCQPPPEVRAPVPPPVVTPPPAAPERVSPRPREVAARGPWRSDALGIGLTVSGGVALATAAGLLGGTLGVWRNADDGTADRYVSRIELAQRLRTSTIVVASVGLTLAIAGVARFLDVAFSPRRRQRSGGTARRGH
jgi:hypothetical protein